MKRAIRRAGFFVLALLVFSVACAFGTLVHLRLPVFRAALVARIDAALAATFAGRVVIDRVDAVGLGGLRGGSVRVYDPDGHLVLRLEHVDASLSVVGAAEALLGGNTIVVRDIRVGDAEVLVDMDRGQLQLARAFAPRTTASSTSSPALRLDIDRIRIEHAWIHGRAEVLVDADVSRVDASFAMRQAAIGVTLNRGELIVRALPRGLNPSGSVRGALEYTDHLAAVVSFSGDVAGIPVDALGRLDADAFAARVVTGKATAERVRAIAPEVPLYAPVSVDARIDGRGDAATLGADATVGTGTLVASATKNGALVRGTVSLAAIDLHDFGPTLPAAHVDGSVRGALDAGKAEADVFAHVAGPEIGHGSLRGHATFDRITSRIAVEAAAHTDAAHIGRVELGWVDVHATAQESVSDPLLDVAVHAERMAIPKLSVSSARVWAHGHLRDAFVSARVAANGPIDASAHVIRDRDVVRVDDIRALCDGEPILEGTLSWGPSSGHARLSSNVDLARLHDTLGLTTNLAGRASASLDTVFDSRAVEGRLTFDGVGMTAGPLHGLDAHVDLTAVGNRWAVLSRARASGIGWLSVEAVDVEPGGPALSPVSWRDATGSVHLAANLDMGAVEELIDARSRVRGFASLSIVARREDKAHAPELVATLESPAVAFETRAVAPALSLQANIDADGNAWLSIRATQEKAHVTAAVTSKVDWSDVIAGRLPSLATLPMTATLAADVPNANWVCTMAGVGCRGKVVATARLEGPLDSATARGAAVLTGFRAEDLPIEGPLDAALDLAYAAHTGTAKLVVRRANDTAVALDAGVLLSVPADPSEWRGSLDATIHALRVRAPSDASMEMSAVLDGHVIVRNVHGDTTAKVDVDASSLSIGGSATDHVSLAAGFDGGALFARAHLTAPHSDTSLLARIPAHWSGTIVPVVDARAPIAATLRATNFRVHNLSPLLPSSVGDVDGRFDADLSGTITLADARYDMNGWAKLTDGRVQSSPIGELRDMQASVDVKANGEVSLHDAHVRGPSGLMTLSGSAAAAHGKLDALELSAKVERREPFPIAAAGDRLGVFWGHVTAAVHPRGGSLDVDVHVPSLHVVLSEQSPHALQDLASAANVSIGVRAKNGDLVPSALAPPSPRRVHSSLPMRIAVTLGNDVQIQRGDALSVVMTGSPIIDVRATDTVASGHIDLVRGTLAVQGKRFAIERGIVTFTGDPANPTVVVTASWDAPDGTHVYADYAGTVRAGKLTLRSDPPHTQDEIVALILFGTTEGPASSGNGGSSFASAAAGAGGGIVTEPLNKALDQLTHADIRTRVDTSGAAAKSEVEVQIAKNISAQVAYVLGLPPPGTEPDRTWLTLAWHFTAHWSLGFTVGDHGSTIFDALWRKRY